MSARLALLPLLFAIGACATDDHDHDHDDTDEADTDVSGGDDTDAADDTDVEEPPAPTLTSLGTATDGVVTVELLAPGPLVVGWNPVSYRVTDGDGNAVLSATLAQAPLMDMMEMDHACPYADPPATADENGLFTGELVPIMASGMMGSWSNTLSVHLTDAGTDHTVVFEDLDIAETGRKKDLTVDEVRWIFTLTLITTS